MRMTRVFAAAALAIGIFAGALGASAADTSTWSRADAPTHASTRVFDSVFQLHDGRVFVIGGEVCCPLDTLAPPEIYDPRNGHWTDAATPSVPRRSAAAAQLSDGRILIAGGYPPDCTADTCTGRVTAETKIYDPSTDSWNPAASLATAREAAAAVTLADGRILVAGGESIDSDYTQHLLASAEL